jgi:hypothetical protein
VVNMQVCMCVCVYVCVVVENVCSMLKRSSPLAERWLRGKYVRLYVCVCIYIYIYIYIYIIHVGMVYFVGER